MPPVTQAAPKVSITLGDPLSPEVTELLTRHLQMMHAVSPPESVHALDPADLAAPGVRFYTMMAGGRLAGIGALKAVGADGAEIKSMHIAAEMRGHGLARRMVEHLIAEARAAGMRRLSLETGIEPEFAPARALYAGVGFSECGPIEGYHDDPNSVFMTIAL
jgi:putative acetyltransferase